MIGEKKKVGEASNGESSVDSSGTVSELESHLGFWLRFVSNHVSGQFKRRVEANGVSVSEWVALRQLFQQGQSSASGLMTALGMTKGAVSKIITRLQEKGLVERSYGDTDLRAQTIMLTRTGKKLVPRLAALADQNDEEFFGHLSNGRRNELIALMKEVVELHHLKQVPTE